MVDFLGKIRSALSGRKATEPPPAASLIVPGLATWPAWDFQGYALEGYAGNPYAFRAVSQVAQAAAGIPLLVYRRTTRGGETGWIEDQGHDLQALLDRPNPLQGRAEWIEEMVANYLLAGDAFALAVGPGPNAPPRELWTLQPDLVSVRARARVGEISAFEYGTAGKTTVYTPEEVLWLRAYNPTDRLSGLAPGKAAARSIDTNNAALKFNKAILENGGFAGTVLETADSVPDEQIRRLREQFEGRHGGASRAGKTLLLEGGLKASKVGLGPEEMAVKDLLASTAREIALVYGVPPELIGDGSQKTFSNFREARAALYTETVLPLLDRFLGALNRFLAPKFGTGRDLVVDYDADQIEALKDEAEQRYARLEAATFLSTNEKRAAAGYSPVDGGDEVLVPAGKVPLSVAGMAAGLGSADPGA